VGAVVYELLTPEGMDWPVQCAEVGGLYKLNQVDPSRLKAPGLVTQPLKLKCDLLVSHFWFSHSTCTATPRTRR
jgi:hypothetical protein